MQLVLPLFHIIGLVVKLHKHPSPQALSAIYHLRPRGWHIIMEYIIQNSWLRLITWKISSNSSSNIILLIVMIGSCAQKNPTWSQGTLSRWDQYENPILLHTCWPDLSPADLKNNQQLMVKNINTVAGVHRVLQNIKDQKILKATTFSTDLELVDPAVCVCVWPTSMFDEVPGTDQRCYAHQWGIGKDLTSSLTCTCQCMSKDCK